MLKQEQTHAQNLKTNRLTAKLIVSYTDDFDLEVACAANELASQVSQHRNTDLKAAKKIVANFIEVHHE